MTEPRPTTFVTFGETMAQYNAAFIGRYGEGDEYMLDCAGAESNVAVDLQKLGVPGLQTLWVSAVGDDEAGAFILDSLKDRTEAAAYVMSGQRTGVSYLNHHADGQHVKTYRRKGSAASMLTFEQVRPHLRNADVLHVTGITPALSDTARQTVFEAMNCARDNGIPVSFDLNFREQLWQIDDARSVFEHMLKLCSLFKIGHDEAEAVWSKGLTAREYAQWFHSLNGGRVIVTRGDSGAISFDGEVWAEHPGFQVDVIDPVGAGDAFVAGLLGDIFMQTSLRDLPTLPAQMRRDIMQASLELANACGALACTRQGDTAAMPTLDEARRFIASRRATATNPRA